MNKHSLWAFTLAAAVSAGPALAAQNVANTSQKGSLLIFPYITVEPALNHNTLIEIANDENTSVHIKCYYVNERKGRVDFDFDLTRKQTASWEVKGGTGNIAAPSFPVSGTFNPSGQSLFKGELVCFATNAAETRQIAWNHLHGTATVVNVTGLQTAFRYNAWSFAARGAGGGLAANGTSQGTPGTLALTGNGTGTYDACPLYNIETFMPNFSAPLDSVRTLDNTLSIVSCNQDLRQDFLLHTTKLHLTVWNENENSFTGAYKCVDSVESVPLKAGGIFVNGTNFDYSVLKTRNARFKARGLSSSQCPVTIWGITENAGLLGVLASSVAIGGESKDQEVANTTHGAGAISGFVLWDIGGPTPAKPR